MESQAHGRVYFWNSSLTTFWIAVDGGEPKPLKGKLWIRGDHFLSCFKGPCSDRVPGNWQPHCAYLLLPYFWLLSLLLQLLSVFGETWNASAGRAAQGRQQAWCGPAACVCNLIGWASHGGVGSVLLTAPTDMAKDSTRPSGSLRW